MGVLESGSGGLPVHGECLKCGRGQGHCGKGQRTETLALDMDLTKRCDGSGVADKDSEPGPGDPQVTAIGKGNRWYSLVTLDLKLGGGRGRVELEKGTENG